MSSPEFSGSGSFMIVPDHPFLDEEPMSDHDDAITILSAMDRATRALAGVPGRRRGGGGNAPDAHTGVASLYEPWKSYDLGTWDRLTDPKWLGRGEQP